MRNEIKVNWTIENLIRGHLRGQLQRSRSKYPKI